MTNKSSILIVGGYGVVGSQIAKILRQRLPDTPIVIAGRCLSKASQLADQLGLGSAISMDVEKGVSFKPRQYQLIIGAVNDPDNILVRSTINAGIDFLDITRWTERLKELEAIVTESRMDSQVFVASGWMAGLVASIAACIGREFNSIQSIETFVLYSMADNAGPDSVAYMDRLVEPFQVMLNGAVTNVVPYTKPASMKFPSGLLRKTYLFDTPDNYFLPKILKAESVLMRIGFDQAIATQIMVALIRSKIWNLLSKKWFTPIRRAILFQPGQGGPHELVIDFKGYNLDNNQKHIRVAIKDDKGQSHLTALGAVAQVERILGLDGEAPPAKGIVYPTSSIRIDHITKLLEENGVIYNKTNIENMRSSARLSSLRSNTD